MNTHSRLAVLSLVLLALPGAAACSAAEERNIVRVAGSTTLLPVVSRAADEFTGGRADLRITVSAGGSGVGIRNVATGLVDIGMTSRDLLAAESQLFGTRGSRVTAIGRDAVAVVVSRAVYEGGVRKVALDELRQIYTGQLTNWKLLGGPDAPVLVVDKEAARGTRHVFMAAVFGSETAPAPGAHIVTGDNNETYGAVARSATAIGMLSLAWADEQVRAVAIRTPRGEVVPTLESIRNGTYPIARDLTVVTTAQPAPEVAAFVAYLLSQRGQEIVQAGGYVPIR